MKNINNHRRVSARVTIEICKGRLQKLIDKIKEFFGRGESFKISSAEEFACFQQVTSLMEKSLTNQQSNIFLDSTEYHCEKSVDTQSGVRVIKLVIGSFDSEDPVHLLIEEGDLESTLGKLKELKQKFQAANFSSPQQRQPEYFPKPPQGANRVESLRGRNPLERSPSAVGRIAHNPQPYPKDSLLNRRGGGVASADNPKRTSNNSNIRRQAQFHEFLSEMRRKGYNEEMQIITPGCAITFEKNPVDLNDFPEDFKSGSTRINPENLVVILNPNYKGDGIVASCIYDPNGEYSSIELNNRDPLTRKKLHHVKANAANPAGYLKTMKQHPERSLLLSGEYAVNFVSMELDKAKNLTEEKEREGLMKIPREAFVKNMTDREREELLRVGYNSEDIEIVLEQPDVIAINERIAKKYVSSENVNVDDVMLVANKNATETPYAVAEVAIKIAGESSATIAKIQQQGQIRAMMTAHGEFYGGFEEVVGEEWQEKLKGSELVPEYLRLVDDLNQVQPSDNIKLDNLSPTSIKKYEMETAEQMKLEFLPLYERAKQLQKRITTQLRLNKYENG